uniref:protein-tyrosine-phosphatase n=1 Tax=Panagrolaimus davidi TaxID=227884 RepID=A0A914QQU8_9BILA
MASFIIDDETTSDAFDNKMEIDSQESSTTTASTNFEELFYDSGISSDSSFSSCSENIYVSTGPTNFDGICTAKKSPELPSEYFEDLDDEERSAAASLNSSWDFNSSRAEPDGRTSPLMDITNSSQNSQSSVPTESPVSRKSSRGELKYCRKRSMRSSITAEIIDSKYLADLINSMGEKFYEQYILIDCRYPFEFNGGHIKGAINLYDPNLLRSTFYPSNETNLNDIHSKKPIFYCEFSSVRGPNMANALRELDRRLNHDNYPHIDYNEIYVLSEGYRHFYENENAETHCEPPSYISMNSSKHMKELRKYPFHKKSGRFGFSIQRSRSTNTLVRSYTALFSPCVCRLSICTCSKTFKSSKK